MLDQKKNIYASGPSGPAEFRRHCGLLKFRRHGRGQNVGVTIAGGIIDNAARILSTVSGGQNYTVTVSGGQNYTVTVSGG